MKLYGAHMAANPRRVKIYLAEKGIGIEQVDFKPPYPEMKTPEFLKMSPTGRIPILELDDGTCIPETMAIIEYLEAVYPEPNMLGSDDRERAWTRAVSSMVADLVIPWGNLVRHRAPSIVESYGFKRVPEVALFFEPIVERGLNALEIAIGDNPFLVGDRPMIPDCHAFALFHATIDKFDYKLPDRFERLIAWYARFSQRPSAAA
ncbi:glutathione S-transferase family protein [Sphingobium sp. EM0848]|uniref:glutathione S-transferase family protein n=1 Tax=Sphingobium sp. EM0848 TaxID=2743473 RepID=UPI00159C093E|nr:glutathione S-transferase family protein [Sphingobium sp. EM0848]